MADAYRSQVFPSMVGDAILRFGHAEPGQDLLLAFLYGEEPEESLLGRIREYCRAHAGSAERPPVGLSHHLACHLLGVGRSNVRSVLLHVGVPIKEILSALDLVRDESDSPPMSLRWSRSSAPALGGAVLSDGIPVCDILQCYLDVRASRARGEEQAGHILDNVLMPHFERKS